MGKMTTYIAILRGINVSGNRPIKMDALKVLCAKEGLTNTQTYIQSGNLVFQHEKKDPTEIETKLSSAIQKTFGFDVPVIVRDMTSWGKLISSNPFSVDPAKDEAFFHVTFLSGKPAAADLLKINTLVFKDDVFKIVGKEVFLYCPKGYGITKLNNGFFENKLKLQATTRNWKTVKQLWTMAEGI
jgi:uncharacterized protein (DUF1697 family)